MSQRSRVGSISRVTGPVVVARGLMHGRLYDVVRVGPRELVGEIVRLHGDMAVIQVHEDTSGLKAGDPVLASDSPLCVELGPGLLGGIFDGIERPLKAWAAGAEGPYANPYLERGVVLPALARDVTWEFTPAVVEGDRVEAGDLLGTVPETRALLHRVLVPPGRSGAVTRVRPGEVTVDDPVVWLDGEPLTLSSRWPVRRPRPVARRLDAERPLVTGQRVIDALFPLARGGVATIPGGFGTGKTIQEQSLAKWARTDLIVYVACGERGNELAEVLSELEAARDPNTGAPLMERTIVIANTSNMPIAAREASIYTGITLAEYYRDQGYHVAVMADSTSRWGEALREVSSLLEELPGEEGYPAYLPARLAGFYERAGEALCLGADARRGSVSIVGAVSPPGGDFSEPITQQTLRLAGALWALDADLAQRRHYPAIHWLRSFSLYELEGWFHEHVAPDWGEQRAWALGLLQEEEELLEIVQLLGLDALGPRQRAVLRTGRSLREDFLQQSAFDEDDAWCPPQKQYWMLRVIRRAHQASLDALDAGVALERVAELEALQEVAAMRRWPCGEGPERARALCARLERELTELTSAGGEAQ